MGVPSLNDLDVVGRETQPTNQPTNLESNVINGDNRKVSSYSHTPPLDAVGRSK